MIVATTATVQELIRLAPGRTDKGVNDGIYAADLLCPGIAKLVRPGQFVTVAASQTSVLRRPFTVYSTDGQTIRLVFRTVGPNTERYARWKEGVEVSLLGPCGQAMAIKPDAECLIFLGGGCGLASFGYPVAWAKKQTQARIIVAAGFRDNRYVFGLEDFRKLGVELKFATQQEAGKTAVDLCREIFRDESLPDWSKIQLFTCGPKPMMAEVAGICRAAGIDCSVFLEEVMGCALGVCKGCVVKMTSGETRYVCEDGPIFDASEVDWNG
ncbi:MAG: hypothetical protein WC768_00395 [Patescibacteria group bacterium]|jgi:dihydroorotate dehydrogenase electron transfer subunit